MLDLTARPDLGETARADLALAMRLLACRPGESPIARVDNSLPLLRQAVAIRDEPFMHTVAGYVCNVTALEPHMRKDIFQQLFRETFAMGPPPVGSMAHEWLTEGEEKGLEQGLEKGREEGRRQHAQHLLRHLGTQRLGEPTATHLAHIASLSADDADAALTRLFEARTWRALLQTS